MGAVCAEAGADIVLAARTEEQLADNLGSVEWTLDVEERARLDEVSAPLLIYPYWHQANTAPERLSAADEALLRPYH